MKRSQFSDAQKAFIIRQGEDGTPVEEVCRKAGISQATYYAWKNLWSAPGLQDLTWNGSKVCINLSGL